MVGFALYCYFIEVNTEGFKAQNFPITKNKLYSISKRLDSVYLFLKDMYILQNQGVDSKLNDFYDEYKAFTISINKKSVQKTDFISRLSEIQINFYKSMGYNKYKVSSKMLKEIATKNNWINEFDEFEEKQER